MCNYDELYHYVINIFLIGILLFPKNLQKCAFPVKEDDLAAGMSEENIDKNRDKRIIPRKCLHF